jgi:hypothetical protein
LNFGCPEYGTGIPTTQSRYSLYFFLRFYPIYIYIKINSCNLINAIREGRNIFMKAISISPEKHTSYLKSLTPDTVRRRLAAGSDASQEQEVKLLGEI